jgi:hypothetical protein
MTIDWGFLPFLNILRSSFICQNIDFVFHSPTYWGCVFHLTKYWGRLPFDKILRSAGIDGSFYFLSSKGTSTGADVCGYVAMCMCLSLQNIGFETAEARLAPGSSIQVYSNTATVQVFSNSTNADHMYRECTVLFSLGQAHFTNQTFSMQNWCLFKMSG